MAKRKTTVRRRVKTGLAAVPTNDFAKAKFHFQYEIDSKATSAVIKSWIKSTFDKSDAQAILANPEYEFSTYCHWGATAHYLNQGYEFGDKWQEYADRIHGHFASMKEKGLKILSSKKEAKDETVVKARPTVQQLMARKVNDTIMNDFDALEDAWMDGNATDIDVYTLIKKYEIKGGGINIVSNYIESWLKEYTDALDKSCEQAVEAYDHLPRKELNRRVKFCNDALADLTKAKVATKAKRTTRVKKPKAADKQVARLQYLKEDNDLKIASVNPVTLIGASRLIVVNTKYKTITEYFSERTAGFEVKGTTVHGWDKDKSRAKKMRKPDEFIPMATKTVRQFDKAFTALTTKEITPNGRINKDCVLLKVDA